VGHHASPLFTFRPGTRKVCLGASEIMHEPKMGPKNDSPARE
jgi:hypothetical protein